MNKIEMNQAATNVVANIIAAASTSRVKLCLDYDSQAVMNWSVLNGNTRGLPVIGSHELAKLGDEIDLESGHATVTFRMIGEINGKEINTRVWIDRQIDVSNRDTMTDKAAAVCYDIARKVREELLDSDALGLHETAQRLHLEHVVKRVQERIDYLKAVQTRAIDGVLARTR